MREFSVKRQSDVFYLYAARAARGFGDGFAAIILPAYLIEIGFNPFQIGLVATAALLGSAALTLAIGFLAPRYELRTLLLLCAFLMVATGIAIPSFQHIAFIAAIAFFGTINPTTGDIGVHVPLEQAALAQEAPDRERTDIFARYSLIGALSIAAGALAAGTPDLLVSSGIGQIGAFQAMFYLYSALGLLGAAFYSCLPHSKTEASVAAHDRVGSVARHRLQACSLVQPGFFRWRIRRPVAVGAVAVRTVRSFARGAPACFSSGPTFSRPSPIRWRRAWQTLRPDQYHGVHAYPFEHLSHCGGVLLEPDDRLALLLVRSALSRWTCRRAHLRDGGGHARRSARGGERHRGPAKPCFLHQPGIVRSAAVDVVHRAAARDLRMPQDRLRSRAAVLSFRHTQACPEGGDSAVTLTRVHRRSVTDLRAIA